MDRVISLEASRQKHEHTLYGDDGDKPGLVGDLREVKWMVRVIVAGLGIIIAVLLAKWAEGTMVPHQNVTQSVGVGDGTTPAAEYSSKDVAELMGYSVREIQDRASKGEIPGARKDGKEWRFARAAVDAAIAASTAKAANAVPK